MQYAHAFICQNSLFQKITIILKVLNARSGLHSPRKIESLTFEVTPDGMGIICPPPLPCLRPCVMQVVNTYRYYWHILCKILALCKGGQVLMKCMPDGVGIICPPPLPTPSVFTALRYVISTYRYYWHILCKIFARCHSCCRRAPRTFSKKVLIGGRKRVSAL